MGGRRRSGQGGCVLGKETRAGRDRVYRRVLFFGSQIKALPCFWKPNHDDSIFLIAKSRRFLFIGREINAPPFFGYIFDSQIKAIPFYCQGNQCASLFWRTTVFSGRFGFLINETEKTEWEGVVGGEAKKNRGYRPTN